jgi:pectinesterase
MTCRHQRLPTIGRHDRVPAVLVVWVIVATTTSLVARAAGPRPIRVASDGPADHRTVQAAVDAIPAGNRERVVVLIKPGVYKERLRVARDKGPVTFRGEPGRAADTLLTFNYSAKSVENGKEVGTSGSYSTLIEAADFTAENVTFENSAGEVGQAVALRTTGDRATFRNCRFLGWQDTLYTHDGRCYFEDCYIEGRVDFIFGRSTAVFNRCHIHSKNGGFVTAAATPQEAAFGYVFLDCRLTGSGEPKAYLGRPWRPYAAVAYLRCEMGPHVRPEGWDNWRNPDNEKTARFAEYQCTGPGAAPAARVRWSRQLTDDEAAKYTKRARRPGSLGSYGQIAAIRRSRSVPAAKHSPSPRGRVPAKMSHVASRQTCRRARATFVGPRDLLCPRMVVAGRPDNVRPSSSPPS